MRNGGSDRKIVTLINEPLAALTYVYYVRYVCTYEYVGRSKQSDCRMANILLASHVKIIKLNCVMLLCVLCHECGTFA